MTRGLLLRRSLWDLSDQRRQIEDALLYFIDTVYAVFIACIFTIVIVLFYIVFLVEVRISASKDIFLGAYTIDRMLRNIKFCRPRPIRIPYHWGLRP